MKGRIVLLGDSIFDNSAYVGAAGTPVAGHLRQLAGNNAEIILLAEDGSGIEDVYRQMKSIPPDTAGIFLSAGGNNITRHITYIQQPAELVSEVLLTFAGFVDEFRPVYEGLVDELMKLKIPLTLCTIYNCHFPTETGQRCVETALRLFNDVIIQTAYCYGIPYIEMRRVCTEPSDFVNEIEPSDTCGRKIAEAIYRRLGNGTAADTPPVG